MVRPFGARVRTGGLLLLPVDPPQGSASTDLSKATKLRDVVFQVGSQRVRWITTALQTITPEHKDLRQISFEIPDDFILARADADVGETIYRQWVDFDRLLVRLWESRSIRPKIVGATKGEQETREYIGCLLPEITKRGVIDVADAECQ